MAHPKTLPATVLFGSPSALYDAAEAVAQPHYGSRSGDADFYGTQTWAEAIELARKGWKAGVEQAYTLADKLSARLVASLSRPEIVYDVQGDMFDLGRVMEDTPEAWMVWDTSQEGEQDASQTAPVTVIVNNGARSEATAEALIRKGAAVVATVIVLEAAGRTVQVKVGTRCAEGLEHLTLAKRWYEPLQADGLAFLVMHPAAHRRINFAIRRAQGLESSGSSVPLKQAQGDIYIGHASENARIWASDKAAEAQVRAWLVAQGVQFNDY